MTEHTRPVEQLIQLATVADGTERIGYRDVIAAHGDAGIQGVLPWALNDAGALAWFAVKVIVAARPHASRDTVISALRRIATGAVDANARADASIALAALAPTPVRAKAQGVYPIPAKAGHEWPGFQPNEFGQVTGTVWRARDGVRALPPIITRALRYLHPHFESYAIYHSPEVLFGIRDRYEQGGEHEQGWRAGKLALYAHGPTSYEPDLSPRVTAGLYLEKGLEESFDEAPEGLRKYGLLDDQWDWPWFVRAFGDQHFRDELGAVMSADGLSFGDYPGGGRFGHEDAAIGWRCAMEGDDPVMRRLDGAAVGQGWDAVKTSLEAAPRRQWVDLHVWRTWPADEAIAKGADFAHEDLVPLMTRLAHLYLDILQPVLPTVPVLPDPSDIARQVFRRVGTGE